MSKQIVEIARRYKEFDAKAKVLAEEQKKFNAEWSACETELLEALVEEGVNSMKIEGVGNIIMSTKEFLSVTQANTEKFYEYLKESGNGGLLKLSVHSATLTAFLKEHLEHLKKDFESKGFDPVTARDKAVAFLEGKGTSAMVKRGITLRAK